VKEEEKRLDPALAAEILEDIVGALERLQEGRYDDRMELEDRLKLKNALWVMFEELNDVRYNMSEERCPRCGGGLRFHPHDLGAFSREGRAVGADITVCGRCGADEAYTPIHRQPRAVLPSWPLLLAARAGEVGGAGLPAG
jgi:hypothetical protein